MNTNKGRLSVGDWVEVRSKEEILKTLDSKGQLDGMPFMPEMFSFCGRKFQVYKRAHKTCDTVFPPRSRRVDRAVHLETRCDGQAHGGCQAACLIFWKEAWLKPIGGDPEMDAADCGAGTPTAGCTEPDVWNQTLIPGSNDDVPKYVCQATQVPYATTHLAWYDIRQYIEDYTSGNVTLQQILAGAVYSAYYNLSQAGIGLGRPMRWFYGRMHWLWQGSDFPRMEGKIAEGSATPFATLNLEPGELVRVKSHEEILRTVTIKRNNRGLSWDAEMVPYCGGTYRVLRRVSKIIDEKTGKRLEMKNPCITLDTVVCQSRYSNCRMFCPRSIYPYFREIWLERVDEK